MAIKKEVLDQLLAGRDAKDVFAKDGLLDDLKKALAERALNAELDDHLDGKAAAGNPNRRNGFSKKTVLTETSKLDLRIPRDREGSFDPKLIARYQRRFIAQRTPMPVWLPSKPLKLAIGAKNIPPSPGPGAGTGIEWVPIQACLNGVPVIPFFAFPEAVRKIVYTTNAIEALNSSLRRAVKIRGQFRLRGPSVPTDEAACKLIFLVSRDVAKDWKMPAREWTQAKSQFAILFEQRFKIV